MSWGSFLIGLVIGMLVFGSLGILVGSLLAKLSLPSPSIPSDLRTLIREGGQMVPAGEVVTFTIGHDVAFLRGGGTPEKEEAWN